MSDLPTPLVAAEVDLRDFSDMMLDVRKLRDSRFGAEVSGDAFRAGVMLWCAAWHQVPCGSVPDDDIELANLAGYGRFVKEWKKSRAQALQGFVKCSDGRLYHQTVSEKANAAWIKRLEHYYERARDRLRKANKDRTTKGLPLIPEITFDAWNAQRLSSGIPMEKAEASAGIPAEHDGLSGGIPKTPPASDGGIPSENALKGEGEGEGEINTSFPDGKAADAASPIDLTDKAQLWRAALGVLAEGGCRSDAMARAFMGKLVKDFGIDAAREAVKAGISEQPSDARSYLKATCQRIVGERRASDEGNPQVAATAARHAAEDARVFVPPPDDIRKGLAARRALTANVQGEIDVS